MRSARGAGALPSAGAVVFESIGAALGPERIAGDVGRPGSAAVALGAVVLGAPGVTVVVLDGVAGVAGAVLLGTVGVPVDGIGWAAVERSAGTPGAVEVGGAPLGVVVGVLCASA